MRLPGPDRWWQRLAWLVALWLAGVACLAAVAGIIKLFMSAAGLA